MTKRSTLLAVSLLLFLVGLRAQGPSQPSDMAVDAAMRTEVIDGALKALVAGYVFPDVAEQMAQAIRAREQRKEYASITSARQLAQTLTDHLRAVSKDRKSIEVVVDGWNFELADEFWVSAEDLA